MSRIKKEKGISEEVFLPNFNGIKSVFTLVIFGELLACLFTLSLPNDEINLEQLSLISLFIQWTVLLTAGVLTILKPILAKMKISNVVITSYIIIILVTLINSQIAIITIFQSQRIEFHKSLVLKNLGMAAIIGVIALRYLYLQYQLKRQLKSESISRIEALQSRIRPHFLFNSMNTIAALVRTNPDIAEQTIEDLADLFRESLAVDDKNNTLEYELEVAKKYLRIEKLRLGSRMKVKWNISEAPPDAVIPHLILQPLLENAVYHGIEPIMKGGIVQLSTSYSSGELIILIKNTAPEEEITKTRKGHQIAIKNVKERLELFYDPPGVLRTFEKKGYFTVEIRIPYKRIE